MPFSALGSVCECSWRLFSVLFFTIFLFCPSAIAFVAIAVVVVVASAVPTCRCCNSLLSSEWICVELKSLCACLDSSAFCFTPVMQAPCILQHSACDLLRSRPAIFYWSPVRLSKISSVLALSNWVSNLKIENNCVVYGKILKKAFDWLSLNIVYQVCWKLLLRFLNIFWFHILNYFEKNIKIF